MKNFQNLMWAIVEEMVDSWRVCWSHHRGKQREPAVFLFAVIPELWMAVQKLVRSSAWQHFGMFVCLSVCLFVCLSICWMWTVGIAVERVLVTGWETLRTSGRTLCAVQRQRSTVQCSWVAEHWEPEPPAASPQLHPASSSCASSELQLFPHYTLYKHTHTGRQ